MMFTKDHLEKWLNTLFEDSLGLLRFLSVFPFMLMFGAVSAFMWTPKGQILVLAGNVIRYSLVSLIAMFASFMVGAKYVQDIYEIVETKDAMKYLWNCIFGFSLPKVKISGGQKILEEGVYSSIEQIGGPGKLEVEPGNAVALETLQSHTKVVGTGIHKLTRFEKIRDILPLEEQFGEIEEMVALTRDGVEVCVRNVQYRFCVDVVSQDKEEEKSTAILGRSFSKRAVTQLSYQRAVGANRHFAPWVSAVQGTIKSIISEHINNTDLDALVTPHILEGHPLDELRRKLSAPATRDRLKGMGVRLISCNIGQLAMKSEEIDKQLIESWFVKKEGMARVLRAQSESENFLSQERGRAEGQAMLLKNISRALQELDLNDKPENEQDPKEKEINRRKNLKNILLARTAQILESRTSIYQPHQEDLKHDNKGKL